MLMTTLKDTSDQQLEEDKKATASLRNLANKVTKINASPLFVLFN